MSYNLIGFAPRNLMSMGLDNGQAKQLEFKVLQEGQNQFIGRHKWNMESDQKLKT